MVEARDKRRLEAAKQRILRETDGKPNCHLCGEPINMEAGQYDGDACELDHLVAVDLRWSAPRRENVEPSHRACNRWRGTRVVEDVRAELWGRPAHLRKQAVDAAVKAFSEFGVSEADRLPSGYFRAPDGMGFVSPDGRRRKSREW